MKMLEDLKKKFGKIYTITVPLDEDDTTKVATLYLKRPDKSTRSIVGKLVSNGSSERAIEAALKSLWVGGDDLKLVLDNDDALFGCDEAIAEILSVQKASLKKN